MKRVGLLSIMLIMSLLLFAGTASAANLNKKYTIKSITMNDTQAIVTVQSDGFPVNGGRLAIGDSPNGHNALVLMDFGAFSGEQTFFVDLPWWLDKTSGTKYYATVWTMTGSGFQYKSAKSFVYP